MNRRKCLTVGLGALLAAAVPVAATIPVREAEAGSSGNWRRKRKNRDGGRCQALNCGRRRKK